MLLRHLQRWLKPKTARIILVVAAIGLSFFVLYLWHLGSLTPGMSSAEVAAKSSSSSLQAIADNPVNAPQRLLQYVVQWRKIDGIYALRLVSVLWASVFLFCFYKLSRRWFGKVVGILSTFLLASTPWFILNARSITPTIMLLMPLLVAASFVWLIRTKAHPQLAVLLLAITTSISLYTPGAFWFVLLAGGFAYPRLKIALGRCRTSTYIIAAMLIIVLIAPLVRAAILDWTILKPLLLIPSHIDGVMNVLKSLGWSVLAIFWQTEHHQFFGVGRWPMLSATQLVLLIFGVYAMLEQALAEAYMLIAFIVIAIVASAINNNLSLVLFALPALCLLAAAGLRYLYVEWRTIFPRNPLPRVLAISLMVVLVGMQLYFGLRYALIAWPHTTDTLSTYMLK